MRERRPRISLRSSGLRCLLGCFDQLDVLLQQRLFRRQPAPNDWRVELVEVPVVALSSVAPIVRIENVLGAEDVEVALQKLPLRLGGKKTRGQAEELRSLLERERAVVKLSQIN